MNPVDMKSKLSDLTYNIMVRIVASKRISRDLGSEDFQEARHFKEFLEENVMLFGAFDVAYYLPFLKWVDPQGLVVAMKNLRKKREAFMKKLLQDHREKKGEDLVDVLISVTDNQEIESDNNDDVVKANALGVITAGTETSSVTIEWALSSLMNHPDILRKAQQEIDTHDGLHGVLVTLLTGALASLWLIAKSLRRSCKGRSIGYRSESNIDQNMILCIL